MKHILRSKRLKSVWAAFIILTMSFTSFAMEDAILAIVNDEVITIKDLKDYVHKTYINLVAKGVKEKRIKSVMKELEYNGLNKLIEDRLIVSRANEVGLEVKDKLIDMKIEDIKQRYSSEQEFIESLVSNGATVSDLRNKTLEQLKIQYIIDFEVRSKIVVNPQEVTEYYKANLDKFKKEEELDLASIFIPMGEYKLETLKKAENALAELNEGGNFENVAKKYSQAPSIGKMSRDELLPVIAQKVNPLKKGEISPIVELSTGFYIFLLKGITPSEILSRDEVNDTIKNLLYQEKMKNRFLAWIKDLKDDAYIEIKQ